LQYRESGSPIVQQISRYGDTPKYADMVDRDIGDIYRHMSSVRKQLITDYLQFTLSLII